jgi:hypothetical protein
MNADLRVPYFFTIMKIGICRTRCSSLEPQQERIHFVDSCLAWLYFFAHKYTSTPLQNRDWGKLAGREAVVADHIFWSWLCTATFFGEQGERFLFLVLHSGTRCARKNSTVFQFCKAQLVWYFAKKTLAELIDEGPAGTTAPWRATFLRLLENKEKRAAHRSPPVVYGW